MSNSAFIQRLSSHFVQTEFPHVFTPRSENSHKGTFGSLAVLGGCKGMEGALILAGQSALKMGCGKVFIGFTQTESPVCYVYNMPEIMVRPYTDYLQDKIVLQTLIVGCGLGSGLFAQEVVRNSLLHFSIPMVLDADTLNILANKKFNFNLAPDQHILTPHPVEAARLLNASVEQIQNNRIAAAKQIAEHYQATVILKGYQTIVYTPINDTVYINKTGNSGLATAGTGDVLSGIIGSLLAQGYAIFEAAKAGVFLHGLAADWLVHQHIGPIGLTASEIIDAARYLRNEITYHI